MIRAEQLQKLYIQDGLSMKEIATSLGCSTNKVIYYMNKHAIKRRSIGEAIYRKHNPNGDPFKLRAIRSSADAKLLGLGLGLYWGRGQRPINTRFVLAIRTQNL